LTRAERSPDVVLVDYSLPDGEGTRVAQEFRASARKGFPETPIVLLSAEIGISRLASDAEIEQFMVKPPNLPELVKLLNSLAKN
jgi:CheY-like chemotaxis protein